MRLGDANAYWNWVLMAHRAGDNRGPAGLTGGQLDPWACRDVAYGTSCVLLPLISYMPGTKSRKKTV